MAVSVKKAVLWRKEIDNKPGSLARALRPLAESRVDLQCVMGYVFPGKHDRAAVEVYPVTSGKAEAAAKSAGLKPGALSCLLVEGSNKSGLAHAMADALSDAGINMNFAVIQVIGGKYTGIFGFDRAADSLQAASVLKKAASGKKGSAKIISIGTGKKLKSKKKKTTKKKTASKAAMRKAGGKKKKSASKSKKKRR